MTDYIPKDVRSSAILTTSYVAGTVLQPCNQYDQLIVLVNFTKGSLTSLEVKVEFSPDGTTYYQETASAVSGGTSTDTLLEHTMTATGNYRLPIPIKDHYIKISVKGTGTVTGSAVKVVAILGNDN